MTWIKPSFLWIRSRWGWGGHVRLNRNRRTRSGRILTDEEIEKLATEVGRDRLRGPGTRVEARAEIDHTTVSDAIREPIRRLLDVA